MAPQRAPSRGTAPLSPRRARLLLLSALVLSALVVLALSACTDDAGPVADPSDPTLVALGRSIFFDEDLSIRRDQSCGTCHAPDAGWVVPEDEINATGSVYEGSLPERFGTRRPMTAAYAADVPVFRMTAPGEFVGGAFWDGRATGERLGDPAAEQAQGPFLNPDEQALPDSACVVFRVLNADYPVGYGEVFGDLDISWPRRMGATCATEGRRVALSPADRVRSDAAYDDIATALAAFEGSTQVSAFSSKFDAVAAGQADFTEQERQGWELFRGEGGCDLCHAATGDSPVFTDHTYANIGVPPNPENPAYENNADFLDLGLGGQLLGVPRYAEFAEENFGAFKVPTLRNVDLRPEPGTVKAYGHNGSFKSLESIVHFHNTRDALPSCLALSAPDEGVNCWPAPEYPENVDDRVGDLGLSAEQEDALVAFLKTLSDT